MKDRGMPSDEVDALIGSRRLQPGELAVERPSKEGAL
jgi:hypothetical protein